MFNWRIEPSVTSNVAPLIELESLSKVTLVPVIVISLFDELITPVKVVLSVPASWKVTFLFKVISPLKKALLEPLPEDPITGLLAVLLFATTISDAKVVVKGIRSWGVSELVVELSVNVTVEEDDKLVTIKVPALTTVLPVKVFEDEDKLIVPAPSFIKPEATALG